MYFAALPTVFKQTSQVLFFVQTAIRNFMQIVSSNKTLPISNLSKVLAKFIFAKTLVWWVFAAKWLINWETNNKNKKKWNTKKLCGAMNKNKRNTIEISKKFGRKVLGTMIIIWDENGQMIPDLRIILKLIKKLSKSYISILGIMEIN